MVRAAGVIGETGKLDATPLADVLERDDYVTRFHTFMSAPDMIEDPHWLPGTSPDVDNHHVLASPYAASLPRPTPRLGGSAALLLPVLLPVLMIRRRGPRPRL